MIANFEEWYDDNFETEAEAKKKAAESRIPESQKATPIQKTRAGGEELNSEKGEEEEREGVDVDPNALAYIRSRKNVHKLNAARKDMLTGGK